VAVSALAQVVVLVAVLIAMLAGEQRIAGEER
jgi:hypothetical protein